MGHTATVQRASDGEYWLTIVDSSGEIVDEDRVDDGEEIEDALAELGYTLSGLDGGDEVRGWPVEWIGP